MINSLPTPTPGLSPSVLVVDLERGLPDTLLRALVQGYDVRLCRDTNQALSEFQRQPTDLVVLDLAPSNLGGLQVLMELRKVSAVPIVRLTERSTRADIEQSFSLGLDDHIHLPIEPAQLTARLARHVPPQGAGRLAAGRLRLWPAQHLLEKDGRRMVLTEVESQVLGCLMTSPDQTVSAATLYRAAWPPAEVSVQQLLYIVETAVVQLQNKIESNPKQPSLITPVQGGYQVHTHPQLGAG